ncbi:MAG TPA: peptidylprolyl isomerase [Gaiellaceae bacterium]|nr:peptidylprolyl isomerase [Gaiellaceae bacterium]
MTKAALTALAALAAAAAALLLAACGGAADVPAGAVAVVDGEAIPRSELDELIERAKRAYKAQKQEFPKAGSPEYRNLQAQYVAFLVQREQFEQEAEELGVEVTEKDVDKAVAEFVKSRFDGDRGEYRKALAAQGFTEEQFRDTLRTSVLSQKIFEAVTKDVQVTEQEILTYYTENISTYRTPESRDVRHILIAEKGKDGKVDFAGSRRLAEQVYAQLRAGADFAELARKRSDDPGSREQGGKLTISRGQTVPAFDKVSFELKTGAISRPVKTEYGYHIIQALSPVRKAKTTPLDKVRESIRATLLQQKRNEAMNEWVERLRKKYEDKVSYAKGLEPPPLPEETETATETQ